MRRREFLERAGRGILGTGASLLVLPQYAHGAAPSDTVAMGIIGVRNIGKSHIGWFTRHKDCRVVAVADIDRKILADRLKMANGRSKGEPCKGYADFREILERKDVDAVSYGTPDHWHGLMACHAFAAGKDVYGEKPMTWCYAEAKAMVDLCTRHKRVFQLGCQRHANSAMRRSAELIKSGALGTIHTVRCWKGVRSPRHTAPDAEPPAHVDYDLWLGPAPKRPFNPDRFHYKFRFYWDYSGGDYVNWWCHVNDLPQWAVGFPPPRTVTGRGEDIQKGNAEAMQWIDVDADFGDFKYFWTTRAPEHPAVTSRGCGMLFEGTKGTMGADFGRRKIILDGSQEALKDLPDVPKTLPGSGNWQGEFLNAVKTRGQTSADIHYSFAMSVPMFLGRIAMQMGQKEGRKLTWDPDKEVCAGDAEATRRLGRDMRAPWKLPG
ncbi:MAG: Gfo/Idh/MocA family protein [Candidatus Brocadiia bacterium]